MPTVSWEPTALNSTYDADEIQFSSGAQLKETAEFAALKGYWRFRDNLDDATGNGFTLTGTDLSTYSTLTGIPGKTLDFNGSSSKALVPSMMTSGLSEFTISIWCRPDDLSSGRMVWENGNDQVLWQLVFNRAGTNARLVSSYVNHDSSPAFVETSLGGASGLEGEIVHLYLTAKEGGNAYFYVNGVLVGVRACGNFVPLTGPTDKNYIGSTRGGTSQFFDGLIANPAVWETQFDITGEHCRDILQSEREIYQYALSTDIYPTTALAPAENVGYTSYTVTETGGGSTAHRLSPDDGTTNYAYAGGVWGVSDTGNAESTVDTYIDEYTQGYAAITPVVTLVSDGFTQHTISKVEIGYTSNNAPTVDAGLDKPLSGHCLITTETAFKPFSDCIIVDEDPGVYTVASVDYRIDSGSWVSIPKGSFTTFQDAARALSIAAGTLAVGSYTFSLRATDGGTPALSTTDTLTVTVVSPTSAFWEVQTSSLTTAGSIGKLFTDVLDAAISSRASQTGLDAVALEATLTQGVSDIRSDISGIDIDTSDLAKELTLTAGISAIQSDIDAIPTDPVLSTDTRLDYLDIAVSSRASSASVAALPTTDNTEKIADLHDGLMGSQEIDPAAFTLTLKRTTGATLKIFDLTDQVDEPSWKNVFKKVAR